MPEKEKRVGGNSYGLPLNFQDIKPVALVIKTVFVLPYPLDPCIS